MKEHIPTIAFFAMQILIGILFFMSGRLLKDTGMLDHRKVLLDHRKVLWDWLDANRDKYPAETQLALSRFMIETSPHYEKSTWKDGNA